MRFSRLRLSGFKSFVEPTELVIEAGLTGVVGPNGCGKSNLLEALRWAMGESSTKSMRASEMDDVIFSGTAARPARNMAEVTITLENDAGRAPPPFADSDTIEISRRIEREAGSAYRINGSDVRARDVQLLFADASTGARSPALVRQGQVGELINARPESRRRILEEAAGITGLHTRRHEAELRLNAAEANLTRLDDVVGQLETQLANLKRQARQATRYRNLSAEIRKLEAAQLFVAWQDAEAAVVQEQEQLDAETLRLAERTRLVSERTRLRDEASEALPPLRQEEAATAAVVQRLGHERDALARQEADSRARKADTENRLEQMLKDLAREKEILNDAGAVLSKLEVEKAELAASQADEAANHEQAAEALKSAAEKLTRAQEASDAASSRLSKLVAERTALVRTIEEERRRIARLDAELGEVKARRDEFAARLNAGEEGTRLVAALDSAAAAVAAAETAMGEAEAATRRCRTEEAGRRHLYDEKKAAADRLTTELQTLAKLLNAAGGDLWPPLIDAVAVEPGYEAALAAALGDDIDVPADEAAPVHWRTLPPFEESRALPDGAEPLSRFVRAPAALSRRLALTGIVAREPGRTLQSALSPGQRLVSREGDLWRWDGFTAASDAPTAAAKRLAERNRLGVLQEEAAKAHADADAARRDFETAHDAAERAAESERLRRQAGRAAANALEAARAALAEHERSLAQSAQRVSVLEEAIRRIGAGVEEAAAAAGDAERQLGALPETESLQNELAALRAETARCRGAHGEARALHDGLEVEARRRVQRLDAIAAEREQWRRRAEKAQGQVAAIDTRVAEIRSAIAELALLPQQFEEWRQKLLSLLAEAEANRRNAADALQRAETGLRSAEAELRTAQEELAQTREDHARFEARAEAAGERLQVAYQRIRDVLHCRPEEVVANAGLNLGKIEAVGDVEARLENLRGQRERLGPVNLRAEEEAAAAGAELDRLAAERDDVVHAVQKLRQGIGSLNREGRERILEAFGKVNEHFASLFTRLFGGGKAELQFIESDDPLEAGLEILAHPPGKRPQVLSLLSGGEQALTALALIFAVFLTNPSPICVLDEVDAPLDDYNVERFCNLLDAMLERADTRFLVITHNPITMARMHRLFGVTMMERGVSQLVSVDLGTATAMREAG